MRIFHGDYSDGNIHSFLGELTGEGAETGLHAHRFDHTMRIWLAQNDPGVEVELYARLADGTEKRVQWDVQPGVLKRAVVRAGVAHTLRLVRGEHVWYECLWSHWQPVGNQITRFADPKLAAGEMQDGV